MAYIRTIKASFFTSDDIVSLSPLARLLYIALWTEADREGRLTWRPGNFKLRFLPGDPCDINVLCDELVESGLVRPYSVAGKTFAEIPTFTRHQLINNRERASTIPARDADATTTRDDATATPLVGKERRGSRPPSQDGDITSTTEIGETGSAALNLGNGGDDDL